MPNDSLDRSDHVRKWRNFSRHHERGNPGPFSHANWLKGALDLITETTASDTGDSTFLRIKRAAASSGAYAARVTADTFDRFIAYADGRMDWGSGAAAADVILTRLGAGEMRFYNDAGNMILRLLGDSAVGSNYTALLINREGDTQARLVVGYDGATASTGLFLGDGSSGRDVNLYRGAANDLNTDDHFYAAGGIQVTVKAGIPTDADFTVDASGNMMLDTSNNRIYFRSGSTWRYAALT